MKKCTIIWISVFAILICLSLILSVLVFSPSGENLYQGINVSYCQGDIDFGQVKNDGIEIVYIKAGQGNDEIDPYFETNYASAKASGLKIGFYYHVTAQTAEMAVTQANYFASLVAGKEFDCKLAVNFEAFDCLTDSEMNTIMLTFMETLEQTSGKDAAIYSDRSNMQNIFDARLAVYSLWIAECGAASPSHLGIWTDWAGFQYSSTGSVFGISGNVGRSQFTDEIFLDTSCGSSGSSAISSNTSAGMSGAPDTSGTTGISSTADMSSAPSISSSESQNYDNPITKAAFPVAPAFGFILSGGFILLTVCRRHAKNH